jgi:hypothetical protein
MNGQCLAPVPPPDLRVRASVLTIQTAERAPRVDLDGCAENVLHPPPRFAPPNSPGRRQSLIYYTISTQYNKQSVIMSSDENTVLCLTSMWCVVAFSWCKFTGCAYFKTGLIRKWWSLGCCITKNSVTITGHALSLSLERSLLRGYLEKQVLWTKQEVL